jgi:hypothetical protein
VLPVLLIEKRVSGNLFRCAQMRSRSHLGFNLAPPPGAIAATASEAAGIELERVEFHDRSGPSSGGVHP